MFEFFGSRDPAIREGLVLYGHQWSMFVVVLFLVAYSPWGMVGYRVGTSVPKD